MSAAATVVDSSDASSSLPFEIRTTAELGRHAVATRAIASGTRILTEPPLLLAPDDAQLLSASARVVTNASRCAVCLRRHSEATRRLSECASCALKVCAACRSAHDAHECRFVKLCLAVYVKLERRVALMTLLAMMRAAAWRVARPDDAARFDELVAALDQLRLAQPERVALHELAARLLAAPLGTTDHALMLAYARLNLNSFSFTMGDSAPLAAAAAAADADDADAVLVFWRASFFNHSCWPNARFKIDRELVCGTVETIADIAPGESIHLSYAESILPRFERKVFLLQTKLFMCRCERCGDATEGNTFLRASQCNACHNGWLCPSADLALWTCNACAFEHNDADKVLSLAEVAVLERGRHVRQLLVSGDAAGALRDGGALIEELTQSRFHPGHSIRLRIGVLFVHAAMAAADGGTLSAADCASALELCGPLSERLGALRVVAMQEKMQANAQRLRQWADSLNAAAAAAAAPPTP
jgi:hypothetical protein